MGQFRASDYCPICGGDNGDGKWTCLGCTALVNVHRALVRNLQQWRSMLELGEVSEVLVAEDRREYCLWDVQCFYEARVELPDRQNLSIQYCLFENMKEREAASRMGIKPTNPVSIYATIGLTSLLTRALSGDLRGYIVDLGSVPVVRPLASPAESLVPRLPVSGRMPWPHATKELVS